MRGQQAPGVPVEGRLPATAVASCAGHGAATQRHQMCAVHGAATHCDWNLRDH
jgi:hypothetical protein